MNRLIFDLYKQRTQTQTINPSKASSPLIHNTIIIHIEYIDYNIIITIHRNVYLITSHNSNCYVRRLLRILP